MISRPPLSPGLATSTTHPVIWTAPVSGATGPATTSERTLPQAKPNAAKASSVAANASQRLPANRLAAQVNINAAANRPSARPMVGSRLAPR